MHLQFIRNIEQAGSKALALDFEEFILSIINKGATSFHSRMKTEEGINKINTLWLVFFLHFSA
jgi:hypothetical protein